MRGLFALASAECFKGGKGVAVSRQISAVNFYEMALFR
jgi:hypothetical protein